MSTVGQFSFAPTIRKLKKLTKDAERDVAASLYVGGLKIEETAKISIQQGTKTGRIYPRGDNIHQASAPGEAPATDTGRLVNSAYTEQKKAGKVVRIAFGRGVVKYALALEKGTRKMAARPFLRPALMQSIPYIKSRVREALKKAVRRNGK
jgi:HK97 gp10 family phage protein